MTIEETYELADAITDNEWKGIKEELGDLCAYRFDSNRYGTRAIHIAAGDRRHQ